MKLEFLSGLRARTEESGLILAAAQGPGQQPFDNFSPVVITSTGRPDPGTGMGPAWVLGWLRTPSTAGPLGSARRDRRLPMGRLLVAGLEVGLLGVRALGHGNVVVGEQRSLGLFQGDDRNIVRRLELRLLRHGVGILAHRVEVAVDRDPAFLVER